MGEKKWTYYCKEYSGGEWLLFRSIDEPHFHGELYKRNVGWVPDDDLYYMWHRGDDNLEVVPEARAIELLESVGHQIDEPKQQRGELGSPQNGSS